MSSRLVCEAGSRQESTRARYRSAHPGTSKTRATQSGAAAEIASSADTVDTRAVSNHPLREGEHEAITWMSCDRDDGVDYGRVPYARRPSGEPVFDDPEVFTVGVLPYEAMPGFTLLQAYLANEEP